MLWLPLFYNFLSYLVQINYLADCSLEILDDPAAVAMLEVCFLIYLGLRRSHYVFHFSWFKSSLIRYYSPVYILVLQNAYLRQSDFTYFSFMSFLRLVCSMLRGIHLSCVPFLVVFRGVWWDGKLCCLLLDCLEMNMRVSYAYMWGIWVAGLSRSECNWVSGTCYSFSGSALYVAVVIAICCYRIEHKSMCGT